MGYFIDQELLHPSQGVVSCRPDDVAVGSGQFLGQAVDVVVIIVDLAVAVNRGQGFEGAGIVDVFANRAVFELFAEQGVTVPGEEGALVVGGRDRRGVGISAGRRPDRS